MLHRVKRAIVRHNLISNPQHLLVAVSGGADSMAMLYALFWLRHDLGLQLTVAHLDHRMRPDSREDAALVRDACRDLDLPLVEDAVDVPAMRGGRGNLEEVARRARQEFLEQAAHQCRAKSIAVGHTRTDAAETLLLHLLRGAGPEGLRGLPPSRPPYIRPLIECSRDQVREFCRSHRIPFRDDPTNRDVRLKRNAVRLHLLPELTEFNPRAEEALARAAQLWQEAQEALQWAARQGLHLARSNRGIELDALAKFPESVQRLVLRQAAAEALGGARSPAKVHVDALWRLATSGTGEAHLPRGVRAWVCKGKLLLGRAGPARGYRHVIPLQGEVSPPDLTWSFRTMVVDPPDDPREDDEQTAHLDLDTLCPPLEVRSRVPGDRFRPLGMNSHVRVSQVMATAGVPRHLREGWPLLCDQQGVVWMVGVRLSENHKVTERTQRALRVEAVKQT